MAAAPGARFLMKNSHRSMQRSSSAYRRARIATGKWPQRFIQDADAVSVEYGPVDMQQPQSGKQQPA
jgi:hypothetical protein